MRFACQSCQTKYSIADERVTNKVVRLKCQKCGADITVRGPAAAPAATPAPAASSAATDAGPNTLSQIKPIARENTATIAPISPNAPQAAAPLMPTHASSGSATDALGSAFGNEEEDPDERSGGATKIASLSELETIRKAAAQDAQERATKPAPAPVAKAPAPVQAAPVAKKPEWFVLVKGVQEGPFSEVKVKQRIVDGDIGPRTYAWRDGLGDWQRLQLLSDFSACFITNDAEEALPPPPIQKAPPKAPPPLAVEKRRSDPTPEALSSLLDASIAPDPSKAEGSPWTGPHIADPISPADDLNDMFAPVAKERSQRPQDAELPLVGSAFADPGHDQPPRENTRMFIAAAGLVQRKRRQRQVVMVAGAIFVALLTIIGLDVAGVIEIPALGAAYQLVGIENPHVDPGVAQFESNLSDEERERIKQRLLGGKGKEADKKPVGRPAGAKHEVAAVDQFEQKPSGASGANDQKLLADVFDDDKKTETKVETPKFKTPEQDLPQGLTAEAIGKVVESNQKAVKFCFERAIKRGQQLGGRMEIEFTIAAMGTVSDVAIKTAKLKGTEFGDCVSNAVKSWKFPRFNGDPVSVEYPFILSAGF